MSHLKYLTVEKTPMIQEMVYVVTVLLVSETLAKHVQLGTTVQNVNPDIYRKIIVLKQQSVCHVLQNMKKLVQNALKTPV